jgi:putative ABC transport system permease protein
MKSRQRIPFFLIWRHIRFSNKWTLGLIILLMGIAFINLLFVNSLFNGVIESNENQLINTRSGNITITPTKGQSVINDPLAVVSKVDKVPLVKSASPEVVIPGTLAYGGRRGNYDVVAITPAIEQKTTTVSQHMVSGEYLKTGDADGIILGQDIAGKKDDPTAFAPNGIKPGQKVEVITDTAPREFTVRGVFQTKFNGTDDNAYITQAGLARIAPELVGKATNILVKTTTKGNEPAIVASMKSAGIPGTLRTWEQSATSLKTLTNSFVTINTLMTVVGFFIAAVTIFIIIYVDVTHKRQEIGILRAIGIKSHLIVTTYVLQAAVYSFLGVVVGTILYFGILVPYFTVYPFKIPIGDVNLSIVPWDYVFRAATVVAVGMLSGLIPALIGTRRPILDDILNR